MEKERLFDRDKGFIIACDVPALEKLSSTIDSTCDLDFIVGYKIGMLPTVAHGLTAVVKTIRAHTDKPVIYDHQKFGTDIPEICSGPILRRLRQLDVGALIIFPLSGISTLRSTVSSCRDLGIVPVVGGEMTHSGYLLCHGGYIADSAPSRMYADAATLGVDHFVVPGTKLRNLRRYVKSISQMTLRPAFLIPGVESQSGKVRSIFKSICSYDRYAIIGRAITKAHNIRKKTKQIWDETRQVESK